MTSTSMINLYSQLKMAGIPKTYAKKVLPEWWEDEIALTDAGLQQAHLYFSRAFNLDLSSFLEGNFTPNFHSVEHKFKLNKNVTEADVSVGAHYVTAMAKIALTATSKDFVHPPKDPSVLREQILKNNEFVGLKELLEYCSNIGIPVLHIANIPGKKMTGLAIRLNGRFAIVLSKSAHPAYLLFHLAHELGHIAMNHLSKDGFIVDAKTSSNSGDDADENEADAYAIRLLNGAEKKYSADGHITSGKQLYLAASTLASSIKVDVGHIILNFAKNNNCFNTAAVALKYLSGPENGNHIINDYLFKTLNISSISDDQKHLLETATDFSNNA